MREERYVEKITTQTHWSRYGDACWDLYYLHFADGEKIHLLDFLSKIEKESLSWDRGGSFSYCFEYSCPPLYFKFTPTYRVGKGVEIKMEFKFKRNLSWWVFSEGGKIISPTHFGEALLFVQDIARSCGGKILLKKVVYG